MTSPNASPPSSASSPRASPLYYAKHAIRLMVLALVVWGLYRAMLRAQADFAAQDFRWEYVRWGWLVYGGPIYLLGVLLASWFWYTTLRSMGQPVALWPVLRAYFVGNMGKYVPGKALVVVLRSTMIRGPGVDVRVAICSVFVETLTSMAVGACLGAGILGLLFHEQQQLLAGAVLAALLVGLPTLPPVFRQVLWLLRRRDDAGVLRRAVSGISWALLARGWGLLTLGWIFMGISLGATLRALPVGLLQQPVELSHLPLLTACVALGVVAGFVSFLPGGFGAREFVVMQLLAPVFGEAAALMSAGLLRLMWLLSEALAAIILYLSVPAPIATASPTGTPDS